MSLFIANAYAADAAPAQQGPVPMFFMLAMMVVIFYFLLWRPQSKRNKEHRAMIDSITVGNEVVFAGGLMGRIKKIEGDYALITLSGSNEVKVQKASIVSVLPDGTLASL